MNDLLNKKFINLIILIFIILYLKNFIINNTELLSIFNNLYIITLLIYIIIYMISNDQSISIIMTIAVFISLNTLEYYNNVIL